jgi:hypothetical protein
VALRAEAEHGEGFLLQHAEIGVFVGIDFCHKFFETGEKRSSAKESGQFSRLRFLKFNLKNFGWQT